MITREADYAIRAVLELASSTAGRSATELARSTQVPYPFLRRVLGKLTAAHLVKSLRGRNGGVKLARPAGEISLLDVAQAIDPATVTLNDCLHPGSVCSRLQRCAVHGALDRVQQELWQALAIITFDSFVQPLSNTNTPTKQKRKHT